MTTLLFSLALVVLTVALIAMSMTVRRLSEEIDELKDSFEYHKKIHKYERLMAEQKIKEFIQLLDKLKESSNKEENENQD